MHKLKTAENCHEQIIEIVRDASRQVAYCVHLLRVHERLAGLFEFALRFSALGKVPGDLGEPNEFPRWSPNRIDHDMRPKAGAVLANAPAFTLKPAFQLRNLKGPARQARGAILFDVETGEMAPEDFRFYIAFKALSPRIPTGYHTFGIKHVDGIIRHRLDQ